MRPDEQQRIRDLVEAYALGELDDVGLQALYDALRHDDSATFAAAEAWQALRLRTELRTVLDTRFQELVQRQLDEDINGNRGFIGSVLEAIGMRRPRLHSVRLPGLRQRRRPWRWLLLVLVLAVLTWVVWPRQQVSIEVVQGPALIDGERLQQATAVSGGIIDLDAGALLRIRWHAGQEAIVSGPATCSVRADALSLRAGRLRVRTAAAWLRIGLPERPLRIEALSDCTVVCGDQGSEVGVTRGRARLLAGARFTDEVNLTTGHWSDGRAALPWVLDETWQESPALPERALRWRCELEAQCPPGAQLRLFDSQGVLLRWEAERLVVPRVPEQHALPGAPRQLRLLCLIGDETGVQVQLDEGPVLLRLPPAPPPLRWQADGPVAMRASRLRVGPPRLPWP